MKRLLLPAILAALCVVAASGVGEQQLYRSNDFGMLLQPIASYLRDQYDWVLQIDTNGASEVRRLFNRGREARRWEISWTKEGAQKVERELEGDALVARRVYDAGGALLQEETYEGGTLTQKVLLGYSSGRLARKRVVAADGSTTYTEEYLYAANGSLREVRRTGAPDQTRLSAWIMGSSGLVESRNQAADALYINRYDGQGRMAYSEERVGGQAVSRIQFTFHAESDLLASSKEERLAEAKVIERGYDEKGRVVSEVTTVNGAVTETVSYRRNEKGDVTLKSRRSADGLETWKYTLDDAGHVTREEYSLRGMLAKVTVYGEGTLRTEELYENGEMILRVTYKGDTRVSEEVFLDGRLVRERKYP